MTHSKTKASLLNQRFPAVCAGRTSNHTSERTPYPPTEEFTITTECVRKLLQNLNTHKALGPDGLKPQLLKSVRKNFHQFSSSSLRAVYNAEKFPKLATRKCKPHLQEKWQRKGKELPSCTLTSIVCNMMEHILLSQIDKHLENHRILCDSLHGFRQGRSCATQLVYYHRLYQHHRG